MANLAIGAPNWVVGTALATPAMDSYGSWTTGLPAANVLDRHITKVARSTDAVATSTRLRIDLGAERDVGIVGISGSNASVDATIKFTGYSDSAYTTEVGNTGTVDFWPDAYEWGSREWGSPDLFSPKLSAEDRAGYPVNHWQVLSTILVARYWQIEITDTANSDGYIEVGRVWLARKWQATINMAAGASIGWETQTRVRRSRKGARYYDRVTPNRTFDFSIDALPEGETYANPFEIARREGLDSEIFAIFDPDDTTHAIRRAFPANLRSLPTFAHDQIGERIAFDFQLEEIVA